MVAKDLTLHNRTHCYEQDPLNEDTLKHFKCHLCPYSTYQRSDLKKHLFVHSGERPLKCEICKRSFARGDSLKRHRRLHNGEKPYSCNVCNKSFIDSRGLKIHMLKQT